MLGHYLHNDNVYNASYILPKHIDSIITNYLTIHRFSDDFFGIEKENSNPVSHNKDA